MKKFKIVTGGSQRGCTTKCAEIANKHEGKNILFIGETLKERSCLGLRDRFNLGYEVVITDDVSSNIESYNQHDIVIFDNVDIERLDFLKVSEVEFIDMNKAFELRQQLSNIENLKNNILEIVINRDKFVDIFGKGYLLGRVEEELSKLDHMQGLPTTVMFEECECCTGCDEDLGEYSLEDIERLNILDDYDLLLIDIKNSIDNCDDDKYKTRYFETFHQVIKSKVDLL